MSIYPTNRDASVSLKELQVEYGAANGPVSVSDYLSGGSKVPSGTKNTTGSVPSASTSEINLNTAYSGSQKYNWVSKFTCATNKTLSNSYITIPSYQGIRQVYPNYNIYSYYVATVRDTSVNKNVIYVAKLTQTGDIVWQKEFSSSTYGDINVQYVTSQASNDSSNSDYDNSTIITIIGVLDSLTIFKIVLSSTGTVLTSIKQNCYSSNNALYSTVEITECSAHYSSNSLGRVAALRIADTSGLGNNFSAVAAIDTESTSNLLGTPLVFPSNRMYIHSVTSPQDSNNYSYALSSYTYGITVSFCITKISWTSGIPSAVSSTLYYSDPASDTRLSTMSGGKWSISSELKHTGVGSISTYLYVKKTYGIKYYDLFWDSWGYSGQNRAKISINMDNLSQVLLSQRGSSEASGDSISFARVKDYVSEAPVRQYSTYGQNTGLGPYNYYFDNLDNIQAQVFTSMGYASVGYVIEKPANAGIWFGIAYSDFVSGTGPRVHSAPSVVFLQHGDTAIYNGKGYNLNTYNARAFGYGSYGLAIFTGYDLGYSYNLPNFNNGQYLSTSAETSSFGPDLPLTAVGVPFESGPGLTIGSTTSFAVTVNNSPTSWSGYVVNKPFNSW